MLSYRHAFHAGNFADVLKHIVWQQILLHLNKKPKPYCVVDTHAGAGMYSLSSAEAVKTSEFSNGIAKLSNSDDMPQLVSDYLALVNDASEDKGLSYYPGSPWITLQLLRSIDRAWFSELHPADFALLEQTVSNARANPRKVKAVKEDGYRQLIATLPPIEKRGAVLIDPSYEIKDDYQRVVTLLKDAYKRFSTGTYALWYPVVSRERIDQMETELISSGIKNIQLYELGIEADSRMHGMTSAGMVVINPPWMLSQELEKALPWLAKSLAGEEGCWRMKELVSE